MSFRLNLHDIFSEELSGLFQCMNLGWTLACLRRLTVQKHKEQTHIINNFLLRINDMKCQMTRECPERITYFCHERCWRARL